MTKTIKIVIGVFGLIFLCQIIFFWDYIGPIHWGQIKVSGLACTCPDESVVNGEIYLRSITPDSLKKYNLDYSEIYVTDRPSSNLDPMGLDLYIIKGNVIGKERVSQNSPWNPKIEIDEWHEVDIIKDYGIKFLFFLQLLIFGLIVRKSNKTVYISEK